jgi:hypothetical protein
MKTIKIKIPKDKILKMNKAASRQAQIELGIPHLRSTICKSKKTYTRKTKHKVPKF